MRDTPTTRCRLCRCRTSRQNKKHRPTSLLPPMCWSTFQPHTIDRFQPKSTIRPGSFGTQRSCSDRSPSRRPLLYTQYTWRSWQPLARYCMFQTDRGCRQRSWPSQMMCCRSQQSRQGRRLNWSPLSLCCTFQPDTPDTRQRLLSLVPCRTSLKGRPGSQMKAPRQSQCCKSQLGRRCTRWPWGQS
jgi:hypothetical protein